MELTAAAVADERDRVRERDGSVVPLINAVREDLGEAFDTEVATIDAETYRREVDAVFADGDVAVNLAALARMLRELDVPEDYPGFIVDEVLGRELAGLIAGNHPLGMLAEATFHYADIVHHPADATAGEDDLEAALAAGFQTRLPGWDWIGEGSPFGVPPDGP